jgi:hypothetical protein
MNFDDVSSPNRFALPILFLYPRAIKRLHRERVRRPILVIAVPLVLMIVGMVLNRIGLSFDQPPSSSGKTIAYPLIQYDFPGNQHALAHGVYRVAAFIGELRDFDDLIGWRGGLDVKKIAEPSRGL